MRGVLVAGLFIVVILVALVWYFVQKKKRTAESRRLNDEEHMVAQMVSQQHLMGLRPGLQIPEDIWEQCCPPGLVTGQVTDLGPEDTNNGLKSALKKKKPQFPQFILNGGMHPVMFTGIPEPPRPVDMRKLQFDTDAEVFEVSISSSCSLMSLNTDEEDGGLLMERVMSGSMPRAKKFSCEFPPANTSPCISSSSNPLTGLARSSSNLSAGRLSNPPANMISAILRGERVDLDEDKSEELLITESDEFSSSTMSSNIFARNPMAVEVVQHEVSSNESSINFNSCTPSSPSGPPLRSTDNVKKGSQNLEDSLRLWIERTTESPMGTLSPTEWLHDGQVLYRLVTSILPNADVRYNHLQSTSPRQEREVLSLFFQAVRSLGVSDAVLFTASDLKNGQNWDKINGCLRALSEIAWLHDTVILD